MSEGELGLTIPIVGITLSMAVAIVAIITWHRRNAQELEQRHKERMAAIDKGLDLPVELVKVAAVRVRPRYLLRGLVWLGVGLALVYGARDVLEQDASSFGWIPVAVGAAYLIFYLVEGRRESDPRKTATPADVLKGRDA
jgi:hypothetical protein